MATLEEQRRAIGTRNEAERRAIGTRNAAERRGEQLVEDINRTVQPSRQGNTLPTLEPKGTLPAKRGRGTWEESGATAAGTGTGIASPLKEKTTLVDGQNVPQREYWSTGLKSSDGLFLIPSIKTLNLVDANGADVQIQLAEAGLIT